MHVHTYIKLLKTILDYMKKKATICTYIKKALPLIHDNNEDKIAFIIRRESKETICRHFRRRLCVCIS